MNSSREFLERRGLPGHDPADCPSSIKRFPDGGQYRIEIPSTEGPRALALVEQREGRGGHEPERHERDEKLGEAHAGSVVADAARVNAQ